MKRYLAVILGFSLLAMGQDCCDPEQDVDQDGYPCIIDCDDHDPNTYSGATEICDGEDNDCDGDIDEDAGDKWYLDADGDGHGDADVMVVACDPPDDYVASSNDCDDTDAGVYYGAEETCNGQDDDCDLEVDEGVTVTFYRDADGDGIGTGDAVVQACEPPAGFAPVDGDCDDTDASIFPGAEEVCDGADNDCNGLEDDTGGAEGIYFTSVPPYCATGSQCYLYGDTCNASSTSEEVAVFIFVPDYGWVNKPYWSPNTVALQEDGSWVADVCTGGNDQTATDYCAFIVPDDYAVPTIGGAASIPSELYDFPYHCASRETTRKTLEFSGYTWNVKQTCSGTAQPGPCTYVDGEDDIWVDDNGYLHLRAFEDSSGSVGYCTEVYLDHPLGYGEYRWTLGSVVSSMDPNAVLGLFTFDTMGDPPYGEIDIEIARWGNPDDPTNAQYVVQPYTSAYYYRFTTPACVPSTHGFRWEDDVASFRSACGDALYPENPEDGIDCQVYASTKVPDAGNEVPRMNLWWFTGHPSVDGASEEVVIRSFTFVPPEDLPEDGACP